MITRLSDFWTATEEERDVGLEYRFEVDVLYYDSEWQILQVQDESLKEYALPDQGLPIKAGQRVVLTGRTRGTATSFELTQARYEIVGEAEIEWQPINVDEAPHASLIDHPVEVRGLVESQRFDGPGHLQLSMVCDGRRVNAWVLLDVTEPVPEFAGMMVTVRGVHAARIDALGKVTSLDMFSPGLAMVEVDGGLAGSALFERPAVAVQDLANLPVDQPAKIRGKVSKALDDGRLWVRGETGAVEVRTAQSGPFEVGQLVTVVGFPKVEGVEAAMIRALVMEDRIVGEAPVDGRGRVLHRIAASVLELSPEQASRSHPVRLEGVVTWSDLRAMMFFVQDSSGGIGVYRSSATQSPPDPGRHVVVQGVTVMGAYSPMVQASQIEEQGDFVLPRPRGVTLEHALTGVEEAQWVEMSGYVHQVRRDGVWARVELTTPAGTLIARMSADDRVAELVGAVVKVRGVCSAVTDSERKLTGIELWVPGMDAVTLIDKSTEDLAAIPLRSLGDVGRFNTATDQRRRIKVEGTVLHWAPSGWVYLQDGDERLTVQTRQEEALVPGTRVVAAGFQGREGGRTVLREARLFGAGKVPLPEALALTDLREGQRDWDGRRVRLQGRVVERFRSGGVSKVALQNGRMVFECELVEPDAVDSLPEPGSEVEVEGVYTVVFDDRANPVGFRLLLNSASQITMLESPPWWTRDRIVVVAGLLVGSVGLVLGWVWSLQRRVSKQAYEINEQIRRATQLESELQQALRLESLGSLAGGIAHDFNSQLAVIMDHIAGLGAGERLSGEGRDRLEASRLSAMKARDLAHRLLTFAKGGAPRFESLDLVRLVTETVATFGRPENIPIAQRVVGACPPVWVDAGQMQQLVQNLLLNACQAMPRGGNLTVEIDEDVQSDAKASLLPPGHYVKLTVSDNGEGISDRSLPQVFDPYFTTRPGAQGLGLAVVYSIARRHGGRVSIHSKAMVGTTVEVWMPTRPPDQRGSG